MPALSDAADPLAGRLEAALAWCQRREQAREAGKRAPHPTASQLNHILVPSSPRAQQISDESLV